jgi:hypothetical protein
MHRHLTGDYNCMTEQLILQAKKIQVTESNVPSLHVHTDVTVLHNETRQSCVVSQVLSCFFLVHVFSYVWCMLQSCAMVSFVLINWDKPMCRSYHHWLLPWDLMVLLVSMSMSSMSMSSKPIWCPTQGSTSCLDEVRRVHRCKRHRVVVFAACNEQGISDVILHLFIHLVLPSPMCLHNSWLLYYTNLISPSVRNYACFYQNIPNHLITLISHPLVYCNKWTTSNCSIHSIKTMILLC